MKLWMSAEFSGEIGDVLRPERNFVEDRINEVIENNEYGLSLKSWDVILVAMEEDDFNEITKYSRTKHDMDFRLKINYHKFINSTPVARQTQIYLVLLRSLDILVDKGISLEGVKSLKKDLNMVAKNHGWV